MAGDPYPPEQGRKAQGLMATRPHPTAHRRLIAALLIGTATIRGTVPPVTGIASGVTISFAAFPLIRVCNILGVSAAGPREHAMLCDTA
jgi:hypothetical protein